MQLTKAQQYLYDIIRIKRKYGALTFLSSVPDGPYSKSTKYKAANKLVELGLIIKINNAYDLENSNEK